MENTSSKENDVKPKRIGKFPGCKEPKENHIWGIPSAFCQGETMSSPKLKRERTQDEDNEEEDVDTLTKQLMELEVEEERLKKSREVKELQAQIKAKQASVNALRGNTPSKSGRLMANLPATIADLRNVTGPSTSIEESPLDTLLREHGQQTTLMEEQPKSGTKPQVKTTSEMFLQPTRLKEVDQVGANGSAFKDLTLIQLINQLPAEVRKISWEVQKQVAKPLNQLKEPITKDWRLVASRLCFSVADIDAFSQSLDPTMEMLKHCNNTSTKELLQIIQNVGRNDVLEDLLKYLNQNVQLLPTQEPIEDDDLPQPFEESCTASDISKLSEQPSEQEDDKELDKPEVFERFLNSEESRTFWRSISGGDSVKKWKDFWAAALTACPEESKHGGIDRFLCYIFKIDYDEGHDGEVRLEFYLWLLAFFGPFKPGDDGCLKKMYDLIGKSVSRLADGKKHSWFAGYMNKEDTEKRLNDANPGTFIVRFSGSKVDKGWFVLAVKTGQEVVQIEIEKDRINNKLLLVGRTFPDLPAIVDKLRRETIVHECRQLLINPCPDLPLNSNFLGYTKATSKRGRGRGKLR